MASFDICLDDEALRRSMVELIGTCLYGLFNFDVACEFEVYIEEGTIVVAHENTGALNAFLLAFSDRPWETWTAEKTSEAQALWHLSRTTNNAVA